MAKLDLVCPKCCAPLHIDEKFLGKKGRCPTCKSVFVIDRSLMRTGGHHDASELDVVTWLGAPAIRDEPEAAGDTPARTAPTRTAPTFRRPSPSARPSPGAAEPARFKIRLDHVDNMGAFFLFDARLLRDDRFRSSFPQRCILCGSQTSLSVYPVVWSCKLKAGKKSRARDAVDHTPYVHKLADLGDAQDGELIGRLKNVENVPEPYCLPFPYYVCPSCSPVGALVTHVHTRESRSQPGVMREICELGISSLSQAERFAKAVCGPETTAVARIHKARQECTSDEWRRLPLAVRNRIKLWYSEQPGERFVAYVSDADFAKAEAGTAGLVVTDQRIVYRKSVAQAEFSRSQPISLEEQTVGHRTLLVLSAAGGKWAKLSVDPDCMHDIRRLLRVGAKGRTVLRA